MATEQLQARSIALSQLKRSKKNSAIAQFTNVQSGYFFYSLTRVQDNQGWHYGTVRSEFAYYVPRTLNRTNVPYLSSIFEPYRIEVLYSYHYKKNVPHQRTGLLSKN